MDANELPDCIRRLIRPRLALRAEQLLATDSVVGVWGGEGAVPLPPELLSAVTAKKRAWSDPEVPRHWISVDCSWLERNGFGLSGCLSVYELPNSPRYVVVTDSRKVDWSDVSGVPLFGQEELCFPMEEILDTYLTDAEKETLGWQGLKVGPRMLEYFEFAREGFPLERDLVAVLGGWETGWADGLPDLPRLKERNQQILHGPIQEEFLPRSVTFRSEPYRLVLWTLRDPEPWLEVWGDDLGELHVVDRIS